MADIMTPALGESVTEATVARWMKKAGDAVRKDEILVELETDKVSLEVAAPADGVLEFIAAEEGATVEPGAVLGRLAEGAVASAPAAAPAPKAEAPKPAPEQMTFPAYGITVQQETTILLRDEPNGKIPTTGALKTINKPTPVRIDGQKTGEGEQVWEFSASEIGGTMC